MEIRFGKKAMFFTIVAITIITVLILSLTGKPSNYFEKDRDYLETEFQIMNGYIQNIKDHYSKDIFYIQSYNAIRAMVNITNNRTKIDDVNTSYRELVINGTHNNANNPFMKDRKISNFTIEMSELAKNKLKIDSSINITNPRIYQNDPWFVTAVAELILNVSKNNLSYYSNETFSVNIPIMGFEDPIYRLNNYTNIIEKTNITTNKFNDTTVVEFIISRKYRESTYAPNFLMRLENNTNSSDYGIESLIPSNDTFTKGNIANFDVTFVDYVFWSQHNRTCTNGQYEIFNFTGGGNAIGNNPDTEFIKLDKQYLELYGMNQSYSGVVSYCLPIP